ncbi:hypothetical protein HJC23_012106 [Cyclotella cryptica]|uniref:Uncharacterized protein n=1 Tax=Cyclotella cryptica TaxID=29204 RepID=A0ABD3P4A6_9STRA|eukprot:CCRYP_017421-RA/>CCRYP_017421-RA protein AED:0.27 eAED:0.27 QI:0/-1/0/1/-1/1/1/0/172
MEDPSATTSSYINSKIDAALSVLDHLAARVTASATTGFGCGAAYATYKGYPIAKTSLSAAVSCALISTACFGVERIAYGILRRSDQFVTGFSGNRPVDGTDSARESKPSPNLLYGSHALGGLVGGGLVGILYQGAPLKGSILFTPIMLGISQLEISLEKYKAERIQQLKEAD